MSNQKIVTESALSAIASDIKGAIQNIPRPMKFKGTLGVGGTITSLPAASSSNEGDTYTVITAGTYRGLVCVVGDNVSSTGTTWVKNPTASSLMGLNDTFIDNPQDGQLLTFDGGSNKWVNGVMTATASGSIATFDNGGDDIPVSEFECDIVAQQASGTPTPDNPLPITGFSQADITVTDNDQIANLYTVSFGQTIYGGRLIYKNGQWSIEATHIMLNFSDFDFSASNPSSHVFRGDYSGTYKDNIKFPPNPQTATTAITEHYEAMAWQPISASDNGKFAINDYGTVARFVFVDYNYSTQADFETARASDKIVVPIITPVIIPITSATRVKTISGDNNIYSNTGNCELKYFTNKADSLAELIKAFVV